VKECFQDKVLGAICPGLTSDLIFASWVAGITEVSH
jgi:hypothetical protein